MNKVSKLLLVLLILIVGFVLHILSSTGFFKTINPQFEGKLFKKVYIKGAEDIMISRQDSFALISATNRQIYPPQEEELGHLHLLSLKDDSMPVINLTEQFDKAFAPHGISFFKIDSTYRIMAISHTELGHTIEVFTLNDKELTHERTISDPSLVRPNDLVMIDENRFYFTNDHKYTKGIGRIMEDYLGLTLSNLVYYDGHSFREVDKGIAYANGINFDSERDLLFVASPRGFLVKVYKVQAEGSLEFIEDIDCGTGVDNIEFDEDGQLWIGCHPDLLHFAAYAKGKKEISPSEIIKINYRAPGDYTVKSIYTNDGSEMSASTVAATFGDFIFTGNVMDDHFIILKK